MRTEADKLLAEAEYDDAASNFRGAYGKILDEQSKGKRFHKGSQLYQLGVSLALARKDVEAFEAFVKSCIEDFVTGTQIDRDPKAQDAYKILKDEYNVPSEFFLAVEKSIVTMRDSSKSIPATADEILNNALLQLDLKPGELSFLIQGDVPKFSFKKRPISQLEGEPNQRVFVGGNYDHMVLLREIEKMVRNIGKLPIFAYNYEVDERRIYETDLMLLEKCKTCIFEVTTGNGHMVEIQRAIDLWKKGQMRVLLLYQTRDLSRRRPSGLSSMLGTCPCVPESYLSLDEMNRKIARFLRTKQANQ